MRVTIEPLARPQATMVIVDASELNAWAVNGTVLVLEPEPDGLEGWRAPAEVRDAEQPALPRQHGTFWPEALYMGGRTLTVRGNHGSAWNPESSSLATVRFRDELAAMVGETVRVTVEDQAGAREVTGFLPAPPVIRYSSDVDTGFSIIVSCPDPLKYGSRADYPVSGSSVTVANAGTGLVAPVLTVSSAVSVLDVRYGGARVRWTGSASSLVLDLADGRPLGPDGQETGVLVFADYLRIPQGEHVLSVECDGDLTVSVRSGWK